MITEGPARQHGRSARQFGVLGQDLFQIAHEHIEIHFSASGLYLYGLLGENTHVKGSRWVEIVEEETIPGSAHVKGYVLVTLVRFACEGIAVQHLNSLPATIQIQSLVAEAINALVRP